MTFPNTDQTNTAATNAVGRTELETRLTSPQGQLVRAQHLARLHALATRIDRQINGGLNRTDYQIGRSLARAVAAATEILEQHPAARTTTNDLPTPANPSTPPPSHKR